MNPEILALQQQIEELRKELYNGNFSAQQDFSKRVHFNTRLKVPVVTTLPSTCEIGELIARTNSGVTKLYVASALNTWTIVGTQS
jgi:hypothetical protein